MGIGYFSAAEGIVGDNIQHVVRELVTAPELKLVLGRHAHEENIHADSLLYMISSLGINPHECEAMFEDIPTIKRKNEFVTRVSQGSAPRPRPHRAGEQEAAREEHLCLRPVHGRHPVLRPLRHDPVASTARTSSPASARCSATRCATSRNHIEVFRNLFMDLVEENREIWTAEFKEELRDTHGARPSRWRRNSSATACR